MAKRRNYRRNANGQFARTGSSSSRSSAKAKRSTPTTTRRAPAPKTATARQRRRRRVVVAGSVAVGAVLVSSQAHPASRTRTAPARRRIERAYVARAAADHRKLASLRASAFPTSVMTAGGFDPDAARREAAKLTSGYRAQVKRARRSQR